MPQFTLRLLFAATLFLNIPHVSVVNAENVLSVDLQSGRTFSGQVDIRTNPDRLWLRYGSSSTHIIRPIKWDRIVRARLDGNELELGELPSMAQTLRSEPGAANHLPGDFYQSPSDMFGMHETTHSDQTDAERAKLALGLSKRVRSVRFDAYLGNWDGDAEPDGLALVVYPLSADGRVVAIDGTLRVVLTAVHGQSPQRRGRSAVKEIGRWTKRVASEDIGYGDRPIHLPFQRIFPDTEDDVAIHGLVSIEYVVPGHGVFAASQDGVRIQQCSSTRDAQQHSRAKRR